MKDKLSRIRSPWRRRWISFVVNACLFAGRFQRPRSPRARVHWVGQPRPRRLERALFVVLLFAAMFVFEPRQYMLWAILWGVGAAIFVNLCVIYYLIPRRNYH